MCESRLRSQPRRSAGAAIATPSRWSLPPGAAPSHTPADLPSPESSRGALRGPPNCPAAHLSLLQCSACGPQLSQPPQFPGPCPHLREPPALSGPPPPPPRHGLDTRLRRRAGAATGLTHIVCFPALGDYCLELFDVRCLKTVDCIYFVQTFNCFRQEDKSSSCYSILARGNSSSNIC